MDVDIDQESLALIIELQLQDLRHMTEGSHDTNQSSDSEMAALLIAADTSTRAGPSFASEESDDLRRCAGSASDVALTGCPCSHDYCRDCMANLFNAAIGDESLFPPRCCKMAIPIDLVQSCLSAELLATYEAKKLEYMILNGTYCDVPTVPTCSTLVPPASVQDDVATCINYQKKTCTICKGESHPQILSTVLPIH
ncbi:hypothetical protein E4U26_004976 [Claviceps purpurea]|nr:hypothetical protein E4U26_004976 [Claviceps purpurea]